jgi:hypothetical protein
MATSLTKKLQLKPGQTVTVLNAPQGYAGQLATALEGVTLSTEEKENAEVVLLFVNNLAEAEQLSPEGIATVRRDGLLWIAYPKGSSGVKTDINRDTLWKVPQKSGWDAVRQIALDETWSAIRFRPVYQIKR